MVDLVSLVEIHCDAFAGRHTPYMLLQAVSGHRCEYVITREATTISPSAPRPRRITALPNQIAGIVFPAARGASDPHRAPLASVRQVRLSPRRVLGRKSSRRSACIGCIRELAPTYVERVIGT